MKESMDELKGEVKAKLLYWNNIKSSKVKVLLIVLFLGLIGLKIFTTVLTFDWLVSLFS
ncbi:hypothetical protein [Colwellia sp. M166]|mgnify:CR=1|jgi:hypothetical protein|uniref:hypothetical protein n=1 Tax=Colwellia sp. M166 TaxID=2583805 RepID=UPI00211ED672|nr:hypothetical protein [Colwellia sp. M166]|tara:strand:- start:1217 stop:1393 length:177 start_codon:yes stop_codon:yes gene_type:complete